MGRKDNFRYGPRLIDIDIIFFKGEEIDEEGLLIPHYDWKNRLFVVQPLYMDQALTEIDRCVKLGLKVLCLPTHFLNSKRRSLRVPVAKN